MVPKIMAQLFLDILFEKGMNICRFVSIVMVWAQTVFQIIFRKSPAEAGLGHFIGRRESPVSISSEKPGFHIELLISLPHRFPGLPEIIGVTVEIVEIKVAVPFDKIHRKRIIPAGNAAGNHHLYRIGLLLLRQRNSYCYGPGKLLQRNTHPFLKKLGQIKNLLNSHIGGYGNSNHHKTGEKKIHADAFHEKHKAHEHNDEYINPIVSKEHHAKSCQDKKSFVRFPGIFSIA